MRTSIAIAGIFLSVSLSSFAEEKLVYHEKVTLEFINPESDVKCTPPNLDSFIPSTVLEISWPKWVTFTNIAQFNAREFYHAIEGEKDLCPELKHLMTGTDLQLATVETKQYEYFALSINPDVCYQERREETAITYGGYEFGGREFFNLGAVDLSKCQEN